MANIKLTVVLTALVVVLFGAAGANAAQIGRLFERDGSSTLENKGQDAVARLQEKGDKEIAARIDSLNKLIERIGQMKKVSDADKDSLTAELKSQIDALTALRAKIAADTDASTTKADQQSIRKAYRVYALVMPRQYILASVDRIYILAQTMTDLGAKLQTKIAEAQTAGKNVAAMEKSITDMNAKIADANTRADNAKDGVAGLVPDNGDRTAASSNLAALKAAQADIKTAVKDINGARKDAGDIAKQLKALKINTSAATTTIADATTTGN